MSVAVQTARPQVWLEGLVEWGWPGRGGAAADMLPPSWVPAFPPRRERALATPVPAPDAQWRTPKTTARRLGVGAAAGAVAALCAGLALTGPFRVMELVGMQSQAHSSALAQTAREPVPAGTGAQALPPPTLVPVSHDAAGSAIDGASYPSLALHGQGSFLVYLPPGYGSTNRHYPVLYLLHGNGQRDSSFLKIGLQRSLDSLISRHSIAPLIAVMIQGGAGTNNWRDQGLRRYESYVLEVQQLADRMLPTVADRSARAIAGYSMGGYGAANIALGHPERFAVMESWLGFFNGLQGELRADRPMLSRIGMQAFLYGGASDEIVDSSENAPFASALRAAGASARSAVYPGGHTFEMLQDHLSQMLEFAGGALSAAR
ncbi:MAG: alpha/beta hydrolase [Solirubrobacterales bacterium]